VLAPSPAVFFNYYLITSSSVAEVTELVDMDTPFHILCTDSTLSLEQTSTKPLLQDWTTEAIFVTISSAAAESSGTRT